MKLRTEILIKKSTTPIEHRQPLLTLGSCFAENMGQKLKENRFTVLDNPFGVLYNPASIYNSLKLLQEDSFSENELIYYEEEWHSFFHHSNFSHHEKDVCLSNIQEQIRQTQTFLAKAAFAIITLGTSYIYRYKSSGQIVSNCHKIPSNQFERSLLDSPAIISYLKNTIDLLRNFNPKIHIILSVSPIRHIKDGLMGNQVSKTNLLFSIQKLASKRENWHYFPAYEIMLDDLRDYRFYEADLIHPNALAQEYIWRKFSAAYFTDTCLHILEELKYLNKARNHKARNPQSPMFKEFVKNQLFMIKDLHQRYPYISFNEDVNYFNDKLKE